MAEFDPYYRRVRRPTERQRHAALLRDLEGLSFREIGSRLGVSRGRAQQLYAEYRTRTHEALVSPHVPITGALPIVFRLSDALVLEFYAKCLLRSLEKAPS